MKVFFDGKIFSLQSYGGISRLFFELMRSFGQDQRVAQVLYRGVYIDRYPFSRKWFKRYYGLRRAIARGYRFIEPFDNMGMELTYSLNTSSDLIYHSTYYRLPKRPRGPVVIHAYDMIHELYNGDLNTKILRKKAFTTADLIISISKSTRKDISELYQIDPQKIVIAYPGVGSVFHTRNIDTMGSISERKDAKPYMLYVGNRSGYKNFDLLLNTFICKKYYDNFNLVLVGGKKKLSAHQQEAVSKCKGKGVWIKQKFCNDSELAELYSNAKAFICTSRYEGFGIPLIESMACGCPVIASNTSSIPEVVGNAALLFNPEDPEDLGRKMDILIDDRYISMDLIRKGRLQAQRFTWEAMADEVYEGYSRLI